MDHANGTPDPSGIPVKDIMDRLAVNLLLNGALDPSTSAILEDELRCWQARPPEGLDNGEVRPV